jgi:hypothetical protein
MSKGSHRWVLLHHQHASDSHYDLMLQDGAKLLTWRLDSVPRPGAEQPAERIADHRLVYLDYEGPISGGRGEVRRIDGGSYDPLRWSEDEIIAELHGNIVQGRVRLWKLAAARPGPLNSGGASERWALQYEAPGHSH